MKLFYDITMLYLDKAGIYYYTLQLLTHLLRQKQRIRVIPFLLAKRHGIGGHIEAFMNLVKNLRTLKHADIIYIPHPRLFAHILLIILASIYRIPVVITVHDVHFLVKHHPVVYKIKLMPRYEGLRIPSKLPNVYFTAISRFSKYCIVKYLGIPENKIKVIYQGVDEIFRKKYDREWCRKYIEAKYGIQQPYILYVGAMHPDKGVLRLIEAYKLARERGFKHKLVMCGPLRMKREVFLNALKHVDGIYLGYVPRTDLPCLYQASDIFVFLSLHGGFGRPVAEAMACGVPVVASNIPVFQEILGDAGVLIDPFDTQDIAKTLIQIDKLDLERLRNLARERSNMFSWSIATQQLIEYLQEIMRKCK